MKLFVWHPANRSDCGVIGNLNNRIFSDARIQFTAMLSSGGLVQGYVKCQVNLLQK